MADTRQVTWGEALVVQAFKHQGGLKAAIEAIQAEVGQQIGTRNTFAKLFWITTPEEIDPRDRFRAWLLLTAFDQDVHEWGLDDGCVPRSISVVQLRRRLKLPTRTLAWIYTEIAA